MPQLSQHDSTEQQRTQLRTRVILTPIEVRLNRLVIAVLPT